MNSRLYDAVRTGDTAAFHLSLAEDPLLLDRISLNSVENLLHISSLAGQTEITREIVSRKPGFARELNQDGFTPIHIASSIGHVELVRELLRVGNDACLLKGKDGKTPLHCAAMKGRVDIIKELVSACSESVKEVTAYGETALHVAVKSNHVEAVKVLMEEIKKLDMMEIINWKDKDGNTMLHLATLRMQHEVMRLLIGQDVVAFGVDVNSINSSGLTPRDALDFILQSGGEHNDIISLEMFQQAGAVKAKEISTNPSSRQVEGKQINQNVNLPSQKAQSWNIWKELRLEIEESTTETQNALMVVATLIATVTYQAILSPPSGFWSAESGRSATINSVQRRHVLLPGEAVMAADHEVFAVFTVFNAIGFFASVAMISLLTSGFPLRAGLRLAMLSMTATYVISAIYMFPTEMKTVNAVVWSVCLFVLAEFARFMIWLLKKWGVLPLKRMRRTSAAIGNQAMV